MVIDTLIKLFNRDLNKLKAEITAYDSETNLWKIDKSITNSSGNLVLHLVGNLNHFIGSVLGKTGYLRQRELEFSLKDVPRLELLTQIEETRIMVEQTLKLLKQQDLQNDYKIEVFKEPMTTEFFLIHLSTHLVYHLGQINYHRRLLT
ncbi:DinB family protein [Winogradskyella sp. UBA3174]|uniref:DinB family protein n=1 Tax=Winogradskyella sp. UBA3174 TaxID=1947785 RepID=UPI0025D34ECA|nr:DinB family protein [Winogradskyella sp. UBA3174]|tara:strand:- start:11216 stop:11659 length:444 start_codon:yes stop_codon:yes gene_type:complete